MHAASFRNIRFIQYRIHLILLVIHSIAYSKALGLHITVFSIRLALPEHPGVHQQMSTVWERYRAPGKAAVSVISLVRRQSCREIFPVQEIFAHRVPPVHGPPPRLIGIILIKHMILSVVIRESVGIIHPASTCRQMEIRAFLFLYHFFRSFFVFSCFTQCLTCHIDSIPFLNFLMWYPQTLMHPFPPVIPDTGQNISA